VLNEKRKNVHAFVITQSKPSSADYFGLHAVYREAGYNPYKMKSFEYTDNNEKLTGATSAILTMGRVFVPQPIKKRSR